MSISGLLRNRLEDDLEDDAIADRLTVFRRRAIAPGARDVAQRGSFVSVLREGEYGASQERIYGV